MDTTALAAKLIVEGVVRVPQVVDAATVAAAMAAFERLAAATGKRSFDWDAVSQLPEIVACLAPPKLTAVVDAFGAHFAEPMVFTNSSGVRDAYNGKRGPDDPAPPKTEIGWHDDVRGVTVPQKPAMELGLTCLIYFDATFPENGAYYGAIGSHHLATYPPEHATDPKVGPRFAAAELVFDVCELRAFPMQPGDAVIHRAHNWHGVMPPRQTRRVMLQTYGSASTYDLQLGHTQLSDASLALMDPARLRFVRHYQKA